MATDVPDISELELCIELIHSAHSPEEAFAYFCRILERSGFDRVTYSLVTDHPSLGLPKQHGLATSYPEDWMTHYRRHGCMQIDPVVREVLATRKPFFWDEVVARPGLPRESLQLMQQAADAGLNDGIGFSLAGASGEIVGIGLARSQAAHEKRDYEFLARAYLLGTFFHETYRDMLARRHAKIPSVTEREHDVLLWAAEGKTDQEIAIILGITFHTVRFHWRQIFAKLEVKGRSYAITKAIRLGVVLPEIVRAPCQKW